MDETVLCYIKKDNQFLMLLRNKEKNDINEGKYIGIGGHLEPGETKEEALKREVFEETGLTVISYQYRAKLLFVNDEYEEIMHLFTVDKFSGEMKECDEGELHWIDIDKIFSFPHWEGDEVFVKRMMEKDYFEMTLRYSKDKLIEVIEH